MPALDERRIDPRTDTTYSLANLLRVRADRLGALAALGTEDGVVMAASHPGRGAEEAVARASFTVRRAGDPGALTVRRVVVDGRAVLLALAAHGLDDRSIDDLADRVGAILRESWARLAA